MTLLQASVLIIWMCCTIGISGNSASQAIKTPRSLKHGYKYSSQTASSINSHKRNKNKLNADDHWHSRNSRDHVPIENEPIKLLRIASKQSEDLKKSATEIGSLKNINLLLSRYVLDEKVPSAKTKESGIRYTLDSAESVGDQSNQVYNSGFDSGSSSGDVFVSGKDSNSGFKNVSNGEDESGDEVDQSGAETKGVNINSHISISSNNPLDIEKNQKAVATKKRLMSQRKKYENDKLKKKILLRQNDIIEGLTKISQDHHNNDDTNSSSSESQLQQNGSTLSTQGQSSEAQLLTSNHTNNVDLDLDLTKIKEKKLIESSIYQVDNSINKSDFKSNKVKKIQPSFSTTNKHIKETKVDYDFSRKKEQKLIEESVRPKSEKAADIKNKLTDSHTTKPKTVSNSRLADKKEATFRTRYFGLKAANVSQSKKEDKLLKALSALRFGHKPSTVDKSMRFRFLKQCGLFVEDYNVSKISSSWNTRLYSQYSYLYQIPEDFSKCSTTGWFNRTDMRGSVFLSFQVRSILGNTMTNNVRVCAKYCCREPRCQAWTLRIQEGETRNCDKGSYCCWLKSAVPDIRPGVDNCTSGIVERVFTKNPPSGVRSAVPLGGLTTGSFELHADGTFHEWTIENQSPGGSAKLNKGSLDMAVLGVRVMTKNRTEAALFRTHPPHGYPGVDSLSYSGAYPVSKLSPGGSITDQVEMDLYAYPAFRPRDPFNSVVPAVAFTLGIRNKDLKQSVNVSFLLNLPLGYQDDTIRMGDNYGEVVFTRNILPSDCARACAKMPKCMAWTTNGPTACLLKDKMPLHAWTDGIISGLKGKWSTNGSMLTLDRPGYFPQSGSTTLYAVGGEGQATSLAYADNFQDIWKHFTKTGFVGSGINDTAVGLHGSASVQTTLQPGQKKTLTIIMSWYYPHRDVAKVHVGNFYSNLFQSSQAVALHMRENLLSTASDILEWQKPFLLSIDHPIKPTPTHRLPEWLNDLLINSVSFWRSSFWTKDGRWRQWEAYDCNDIDTIHNDMQRILSYMLFYPEVVRHLLVAWAANQYSNGMMQEALTQGCLGKTGKLDYAGGRVMADGTSMFVVGVYQYYKWTGDKNLLDQLWSASKRAITWLIEGSTKGTGLPFRKATFYDLAGIDKYDHHIYDSIVYLLALRASRDLATTLNDDKFKQTVNAAITRAESLIDKEFWSEHHQHYRAWWDMEYGASNWIMADSFYGQVWANTLGLGDLVPREKLKLHLKSEASSNNSPWGLRVINNKPVKDVDTSLILSYKFPGCLSLENITKHSSIWMGADADWTSLMTALDLDPYTALKQAEKPLDHWRSTLNDQWNIHGLLSSGGYGQDGLPWASSHHNAHLVIWHIPFAISGQQYSAPDLTLSFWPKLEIPFELPFFLPTASGLIEGRIGGDSDEEEMYTFKVTSGTVHLKKLKIFNSSYGTGNIYLKKGSMVTWSKPKEYVNTILNQLK